MKFPKGTPIGNKKALLRFWKHFFSTWSWVSFVQWYILVRLSSFTHVNLSTFYFAELELHTEKIAGLRKRSSPCSAAPFYVPVIVGTGVGSGVHASSSDHQQHSPNNQDLSNAVSVAAATANMLMTTTSPMYGQQAAALMQTTSNMPCATSAVNVGAAAFPSSVHHTPTSSIIHQQDELMSMSAPFGVQFSAPTLNASNVNERVAHSSGSHVPIGGTYTSVGGGGGTSGRGVIQLMQLQQSSNNNNNSDTTSSFNNNCNVFYDLTSPLTPPHTSQNLPGAVPALTSC